MEITAQTPIAYLSAEFGLEAKLPVYAGGLGILAGDILKAAADQKLHMAGVGLLYRGEEARQVITSEGNQVEANIDFEAENVGLTQVMDGTVPIYIKVHLTQVDVWIRVWEKKLNEYVTLYLLDPDNEKNHSHERRIANALYSGTQEELIKQQLILGVGGVKLMRALGLQPALYHINEGRPSFLHWQLVREAMDYDAKVYQDAVSESIAKTVYTNHTIVAAGNQGYDVDLMKAYAKYYSSKMGITADELLAKGVDETGGFNVTRYALNISRRASSVSMPHYNICVKQWPEYEWVNVTNGVHMPTWQASVFRDETMDNMRLWEAHCQEKRKTMEMIQSLTGFGYDSDKLVICWARRIVSYKQLNLLWHDIDQLQEILLSTNRPVQLLVAGKAHVFDQGGKKIIRDLIGYLSNELAGHALFIPNYDMDVGAALTRGSDVWLNMPVHGQEASGTSGMKAISNGVLQLTMPDGWCGEVDWAGIGWPLATNPSETAWNLYQTLREKVIPLYYQRDENDLPQYWIEMMRKSIGLSSQYSAQRMVEQYREFLYK
ncbi:alpha-glucan family phosphorylase [Microgenomates group bacterium]|nr:alpha-glucan family phosphorylase [Microgenomates group bacterium]